MALARILFVAAATLHFGLVNATRTSCTAAYLASEKAAQITCYFGSHVSNATHQLFSVMHYADSVTGNGKPVLECQYRAVTGDLLCDLNANYTFNRDVKDHIILGIPNAASFHAGTYACHLIPASNTVLPCNLTIQVEDHTPEGISSTKHAAVGPSTSAPIDPVAETKLQNIIIALATTLSVVTTCFVAAIIFIICYNRNRLSQLCQGRPKVGMTSPATSFDGAQTPSTQQEVDTTVDERGGRVDQQQGVPDQALASAEAKNNQLSHCLQPGANVRQDIKETDRLMSSAADSDQECHETAPRRWESSAESEANSTAKLIKQQPRRKRRKRTISEQSQTSHKSADPDPDAADVSDMQDSSV